MTETTQANTAELETDNRPQFSPPEGFRLDVDTLDAQDPDYSGGWDGPELAGDGWKVSAHWSNTAGIIFYADHASKTGRPDDEPLTASQALEMSAALTTLVQSVTV